MGKDADGFVPSKVELKFVKLGRCDLPPKLEVTGSSTFERRKGTTAKLVFDPDENSEERGDIILEIESPGLSPSKYFLCTVDDAQAFIIESAKIESVAWMEGTRIVLVVTIPTIGRCDIQILPTELQRHYKLST